MAFWRTVEVLMDDIVDDYWSEPAEIHPWGPVGIDDDGAADPVRPVVVTRGVLVMPGGPATGEAGNQATGMVSGQLDLATWLSITDYNLGMKVSDVAQGDR